MGEKVFPLQNSASAVPASSSPSIAPTVFKSVPGADVLTLSLSPEEAFVLSRVDELEIEEAIATSTGLSQKRVHQHLVRLEKLGAISSHDPARALDASLTISVEVQQAIIDTSLRLDTLTHFEVLGVPLNADRATIKKAYFSHIGTYHPDTYFKKNLGAFTKRMEKIFQRMTEAHDVLSRAQPRQEYEAYLVAVGKTRPREKLPAAASEGLDDLESLLRKAVQANSTPETSEGSVPVGAQASPRPAIPPPLPGNSGGSARPRLSAAQTVVSARPVDPKARRQALARKLGKPISETPPSDQVLKERTQARLAAVRDLKGRYEHRREAIEDQRLGKYVAAAEQALSSGNPVSALNAIRIASSVNGGSPSIRTKIERLETKACEGLADSYLERGRYEESNGHYQEAARSYGRSARGRPSAAVLRSAAECYLKAGTELKEACDLARQAVAIAPNQTDLRLTLVKVYDAAGMQTSALKELERAQELAPNSEQVKQWVKRLRRGGV